MMGALIKRMMTFIFMIVLCCCVIAGCSAAASSTASSEAEFSSKTEQPSSSSNSSSSEVVKSSEPAALSNQPTKPSVVYGETEPLPPFENLKQSQYEGAVFIFEGYPSGTTETFGNDVRPTYINMLVTYGDQKKNKVLVEMIRNSDITNPNAMQRPLTSRLQLKCEYEGYNRIKAGHDWIDCPCFKYISGKIMEIKILARRPSRGV